ncbi:MAG: c-type cytochrome [Casimicrobiaceae bacterium]
MSDEHTSFIKTPKQLAIVVLLAFAVPISLIVLLTQLVTGMLPSGKSDDERSALSRIQPVGQLALAEIGPAPGSMTGEQVYQAVCKTCHEGGLAGAPKFGDKAAWAGPIKLGFSVLTQHAINGVQQNGKVMPPKGGNADLTDSEVARAVAVMANAGGATFKEPPAPAAPATAMASGSPIVSAAAATPAAPVAAAPAAAPAGSAPSAPVGVAPAPGGPLDQKTAEAMMQKDGCAACHGIDKKIVGPAYVDVAAKYRGDKDALATLSQKVKAGGSGVWGAIPMPPNAQVSDADVKSLVSWILTLKK